MLFLASLVYIEPNDGVQRTNESFDDDGSRKKIQQVHRALGILF